MIFAWISSFLFVALQLVTIQEYFYLCVLFSFYIVIKNGKVTLFQFSGTCLFLAWQISCVSVPMGQ